MNKYKEQIEKTAGLTSYSAKDIQSKEKDLETKLWRDRMKPELKRGVLGIPAALIGAGAGRLAGSKLPTDKAKLLAATGGAAIGGSIHSALHRRKKLKELNDIYNVMSEKEIDSENKKNIAASVATSLASRIPGPIGIAGMVSSHATTPEAKIQNLRRIKESE